MLVHNVAERNEAAKRRMRALLYFLKEKHSLISGP